MFVISIYIYLYKLGMGDGNIRLEIPHTLIFNPVGNVGR